MYAARAEHNQRLTKVDDQRRDKLKAIEDIQCLRQHALHLRSPMRRAANAQRLQAGVGVVHDVGCVTHQHQLKVTTLHRGPARGNSMAQEAPACSRPRPHEAEEQPGDHPVKAWEADDQALLEASGRSWRACGCNACNDRSTASAESPHTIAKRTNPRFILHSRAG